MTRFALASGELIQMTNGLPGAFKETPAAGTITQYAVPPFGHIILKEIFAGDFFIRTINIYWKTYARLVCHYKQPAGILLRTVTENPITEKIKAAGKFEHKPGHFFSYAAETFTSLIEPFGTGETLITDIVWSSDVVKNNLSPDHELQRIIVKIYPSICNWIIAPAYPLSDIIPSPANLINKTNDTERFQELMVSYFKTIYLYNEPRERAKAKLSYRQNEAVENARSLIDSNLLELYTEKELAAYVHYSGRKLTEGFKYIVGVTPDYYCRYTLNIGVRDKMVRSNNPLKWYLDESGCDDEPNLVKSFKKTLCCTPGDLRKSTWSMVDKAVKGKIAP